MAAYPVQTNGTALYRCVVCGEARARFALQVSGQPFGLCSSLRCVNDPRRDSRFRSALPRGVPLDISFEWNRIVSAAWAAAKDNPPSPSTPMRYINLGDG
jgi:hypothetical protein